MKVKVTKAFIDKHTREFHDYGEIIEVTEERANEILSAGEYIAIIEEEKPDILATMTVEQLKDFAKDNGFDISKAKNKAEILAILQEAQK